MEAFKGLSRRASVFHRGLYDDASIPADHCSSITATVGALWLAFSWFAECDLSPVDDQASRTMQFLDWIRTVGQSIAVAALVPHRRASHAIARLERAWRSTDLHVTGGKGVVCQAVDLVG